MSLGGVAKCPSCTIDLGNATSLLASKLVEAVKHECEHDGCKEMVAFLEFEQHKGTCSFRPVPCNHPGCKEVMALKDFEKHKQACLFRSVHCPDSRCTNIMPISKLEEHWNICSPRTPQTICPHSAMQCSGAERICGHDWVEFKRTSGFFRTSRILAHGKMFFLKINHPGTFYFLEIVMMGTEAECEGFVASITVLDKDMKDFASMSSHPRPLDEQAWGMMGLTLPNKDMSKITPAWGIIAPRSSFRIKVAISKR